VSRKGVDIFWVFFEGIRGLEIYWNRINDWRRHGVGWCMCSGVGVGITVGENPSTDGRRSGWEAAHLRDAGD